jgi:hypothetical protein
MVRRAETTAAQAEVVAAMNEHYARYRRVYPALRSISARTAQNEVYV